MRKGERMTDEQRERIAAAQRSPEVLARKRAANARRWTPQARASAAARYQGNAYGAGGRGKPKSPEHREAIRQALLRANAEGRKTGSHNSKLDLGECVYCGSPAQTRDHPLPVNRGGDPADTVPACNYCNESKADRTPDEWLAAGLYGSGGRYRQRAASI